MKYISVIAILLASTEAHKVGFFDLPAEDNTKQVAAANALNKADIDILAQIDFKLDQAGRNAVQGELGRTLAMSKVNEMKLSLSQIKENFLKETNQAVSDGNTEPLDEEAELFSVAQKPLYTLAKKQTNLKELEKKAHQFESRIPKIHDIEIELGLPDNVDDSELTAVKTTMEKAIVDAQSTLHTQQVAEAKVAQEAAIAAAPAKVEDVPTRPNE